MSGHFPTELSQLPFLRSLRLAFNELSGSIPTSLASTMKHMNNIELHYNKITGTLPEEMFYFENLIRFNLGGNR